MNWLDIVILIIIAWYAWAGLRSGLVYSLARLLGVLIGLAAAFNFYRPLADTVNLKWDLVSTIKKWIPVSFLGPEGGLSGPGGQLLAPKGSFYGMQSLGESVSRLLASGMLDILCFIVIFLVVSKAVVILGSLIGKAAKMFLLGPVDRAGGLLLGAAKGCIIAGALVALVAVLQVPGELFSGPGRPSWIGLALQKSMMAPYFIKAMTLLNIHFPGWSI
ncbi:MAG: CvpA family protein [Peptococcaceae bacterium]|nr:CvpA family protein [Peptococcaceae bacterium]